LGALIILLLLQSQPSPAPVKLSSPSIQPKEQPVDPDAKPPAQHWLSLSVGSDWNHRSGFARGSSNVARDGSFDTVSASVGAYLRFARSIGIYLVLPIQWIRFSDTAGASRDLSGLSDLSFVLDSHFSRRRFFSSAELGFTLPTGAAERTPTVGTTTEVPVELGSGTVNFIDDVTLGFRASERLNLLMGARLKLIFYANEFDFREPSTLRAWLGAHVFVIHGRLASAVAVSYERTGTALLHEEELPGTQRNLVAATVRVSAGLPRRLSLATVLSVPVYEQVTGIQPSQGISGGLGLSHEIAEW
jgi:hypothetical protein